METRSFAACALRMFAGVFVWAAHFTFIYAFTALACARGHAHSEWLGVGVVTWAIGAATLFAGGAALRNAGRSFESWMSAGVAALALIAILWETLPVTMLPVCG